MIDAFQSGDNLGTLCLRHQWSARSFQGSDGVIPVDPDDKDITFFFGSFQITDVSCVQKVEAAVGENDDPARGLPVADYVDDFFQTSQLRGHST
jgi:hypothetical protein